MRSPREIRGPRARQGGGLASMTLEGDAGVMSRAWQRCLAAELRLGSTCEPPRAASIGTSHHRDRPGRNGWFRRLIDQPSKPNCDPDCHGNGGAPCFFVMIGAAVLLGALSAGLPVLVKSRDETERLISRLHRKRAVDPQHWRTYECERLRSIYGEPVLDLRRGEGLT